MEQLGVRVKGEGAIPQLGRRRGAHLPSLGF